MPTHSKRVLVDSSSEDEEILYVLGSRTKKFLPTFLAAVADSFFWEIYDGEPNEESSDAEIYLLKRMCTTPGTLDVDGILAMIEQDEGNHLPIMEALCCLLGYDIDMADVEDGLQSEDEIAEVRRIVRLLPRWYEAANTERERASKKRKSE